MNDKREIPFNYTSADDARIIKLLLGQSVWYAMQKMRFQRKTGRLARLLMRFIGDMFMLHRNPFVGQELLDDPPKARQLFQAMAHDLTLVEQKSSESEELRLILSACRDLLQHTTHDIAATRGTRKRICAKLAPIVGRDNIFFDPFSLISHVTDATDWRLFMPLAVVRPSQESQVAPLLAAIGHLGMYAIPRGGGTGLTGGSVPTDRNCIIINTEKLNHIRGITNYEFPVPEDRQERIDVLEVETGVITGDAIAFAERHGRVFATDPTSSWACTIGGNIAENAGGKKAVLWGTAIDNLLSFRIAMPDGRELEVRRMFHPLRKIHPTDQVRFEILDLSGNVLNIICLAPEDIRKPGLGKDITNKALGGLPGLQKEGTDGVMTSARFILHAPYPYKTTVCMEFFGRDMDEAGRVICDISEAFVNQGEEALMALEHFDEEYVRAIQYKNKGAQQQSPKAVLLIDMVGHTPEQLERGKTRLADLLASYPNTGIHFAEDETEAQRYWQDRKRLGAIAARTNAFKLNEDIVLPLNTLAEFAEFVDEFNIEEERHNQKSFVWQVNDFLETARPLADPQWLAVKLPQAQSMLRDALDRLSLSGKENLRQETHLNQLQSDLLSLFRGYKRISEGIRRIHAETRAHLIVIATHMHAGDGNVHVNIPVFSNDRDMMHRAGETADAVMAKAVALGGVVSGEHGIGVTKFKYLNPHRIEALDAHRKSVDPGGIMNPRKLSDPAVPDQIFTPSFNLLGIEARILQHGALQELAGKIASCIRCGRCKADCCVFHPGRNLFFHPRNKNLAIASLIEALLYDAQRFRSTRFAYLRYLENIADHCTICHKCLTPCPVDIDTGEVSILERRILETRGFRHSPAVTRLTLKYVQSRSPIFNAVFRTGVLKWGGTLQRFSSRIIGPLVPKEKTDAGRFPLLSLPLTPARGKPLAAFLPITDPTCAVYIKAPQGDGQAVFYFPGCGSERIYSRIAAAAVYLLLRAGVSVVLPPAFLCCGYPLSVNAKHFQAERIALRNTIIFSQIRGMFDFLNFRACVISCGTCREALSMLGVEGIFQAPLTDIGRMFANGKDRPFSNARILYHRPCHDSLEGRGEELLASCGAKEWETSPHCCAEAGTLALSRPDIAAAMRDRKAMTLTDVSAVDRSLLLTNCPACIQGLGRHAGLKLRALHIAEALAVHSGGQNWEVQLREWTRDAEAVQF